MKLSPNAMSSLTFTPLTGRCSCAALSCTLTAPPLITHICYCTWCQREPGAICAVNSIIESSNFTYHLNPAVSQPLALIPVARP
ncbi:glutathione-dependent formaldehyde- gfa [Paraphaeosphaeria minitans]|uniref:Glutathione-dependent formaldehyde- gfa n=1 Tax=Paraphaeosphaeria minitans TaxID=565426 RepID=A0A9P6KPT0_9PLEO|nr:glutathione-dependent formaldehyde- gfa [Paraphaeosphaeria minitans]